MLGRVLAEAWFSAEAMVTGDKRPAVVTVATKGVLHT
jgi:hypothetical protein